MVLDLSDEEARLLQLHLERHIKHVDDELVRTDSRQMQRDLAHDETRLVSILEKLDQRLDSSRSAEDSDEETIARSS
jgi:predicted site-specific integrase-resolvase